VTVVAEHDVFWLQVSVDDAFQMQVSQSHGNLCQIEAAEQKTELLHQVQLKSEVYIRGRPINRNGRLIRDDFKL
jgi:hypothetical protein